MKNQTRKKVIESISVAVELFMFLIMVIAAMFSVLVGKRHPIAYL
jgi:hypothetical protein